MEFGLSSVFIWADYMLYMNCKELLKLFIYLLFLASIKFSFGLIVDRPLVNNFCTVSIKICNKTDLTICLKISDDMFFTPVYVRVKKHKEELIDILVKRDGNLSIIASMLKNYSDNPLLYGIEMQDLKIRDFLKENKLLNINKENCLNFICSSQELDIDKIDSKIKQKKSNQMSWPKIFQEKNYQELNNLRQEPIKKPGDNSYKIFYKLEKEQVFSDQELKEYNYLVYETISQLGGSIAVLFKKLYLQINNLENPVFYPIRENQVNQIKFIYKALSGALTYYKIYNEPLSFSFVTREKRIEQITNLICFLFALSIVKKQYFTKGVLIIDDPGDGLKDFLELTDEIKVSPVDYFKNYIEAQVDFDFSQIQKYLEIPNQNKYVNHKGYMISFGLFRKKRELQTPQIFIAFDDPLNLVPVDNEYYENYLLTDKIPENILERYKAIMKYIWFDQDFLTDLTQASTYGISHILKNSLQIQDSLGTDFKKKITDLVGYISSNYDNISQRIGKEVILRRDNELKGFSDASEINIANLKYALKDIKSNILTKISR